MERGKIYGDRYSMKWLSDRKGLSMGIWAVGGIELGETRFIGRPRIQSHRCNACKLTIIENDGK
jgi:hypothetical protein